MQKENRTYTLEEIASIVEDAMYNISSKKNIIEAYSFVHNLTKTDYSYDEVKDYLFHHNKH